MREIDKLREEELMKSIKHKKGNEDGDKLEEYL